MVTLMGINPLAVLVVAIISIILGFLWYGPLFGKQWKKLMKFSEKDTKKLKGIKKSYLFMILGSLITSFVLAYMVIKFSANSFLLAADLGFTMWLGFIAPIMLGSVSWEGKPWNLYFLNVSFQLINLIVMAVVLSAW